MNQTNFKTHSRVGVTKRTRNTKLLMKTKQQLFEELRSSDPFVEYENLDTRGFPSLHEAKLRELESKPDPFKQNDFLEVNKSGLRDFLRGVEDDDSLIAEAATRPGASSELVTEFRDRRATNIAIKFKQQVGDKYVATDENMDALVQTLAESVLGYSNMESEELVMRLLGAGFWSVENLVAVFNNLFESGNIPDYPDGCYRPLSSAQWEEVSRISQMGRPLDAVAFGLRIALRLPDNANLDFVMTSRDYRELVDGLVLHVWKAATADFDQRNDEAFNDFVFKFAGNRPLTLPIVSSAWQAFVADQRSILRAKALGLSEPEPQGFEPSDFDKLSDAQLNDLRLGVLREKAKLR